MGFLDLPTEVILLVIPHLNYEYEINALCRTTRRLHELLNPVLYKNIISQPRPGQPLEWAAINGSISAARLILGAGVPPDACGIESWQPFALAALHGHGAIIQLLCEHGVDPCSTDNDWKNHLDDESDVEDWEEGHPLFMAATSGHESVVKLLLGYGVRPDLASGSYRKQTALHIAAEKGYLAVVRLLVDAGSSINAQDDEGATPLASAAQENHMDVVKFLISRGADPNISTKYAGTSLCMASRSGNIDIVRCLLDHGATLNPSYPDGKKPLFQLSRAAEGRHDDIVELLLQRFDYVKSSSGPYQQAILLCVAAMTGRITLLTDLLRKHHYDPNLRVTDGTIFLSNKNYRATPETAIAWAAERNYTTAIEILVSHGASLAPDPETNYTVIDNSNPLMCAVTQGHVEATKTLLARGADPNDPPSRILLNAISNPTVFSILLFSGADPTIPPLSSMILSKLLISGNIDTLRILLDHPKGAELFRATIADEDHSKPEVRPLLRAALRGGIDIFRLLLDRKLVTPPEDLHSRPAGSCLLVAAQNGGIPCIRLLLEMGFDLHAGENAGYIIWGSAKAEKDAEELLDFLLNNGCSVDDTDHIGRTALFLTAQHGDKDAMQRLLARGADPLAVHQGDTVLLAAVKGLHTDVEVVQSLLNALDTRGLDFGEVGKVLKQAEMNGLEYGWRSPWQPIIKALYRFYWHKRYPV